MNNKKLTQMNKVSCEVFVYSNTRHLEQIFTGLGNLEKLGAIDLKIRHSGIRKFQLGLGVPVMKLLLDDKIRILIDTHDSHRLYNEPELIKDIDFYFKRSFLNSGYSDQENSFQIIPLGFNYAIQGSNNHTLKRALMEPSLKKSLELFIRNNLFFSNILNINGSKAFCNESNLYDMPNLKQPYPSIVFMTRLWPDERAKNSEEKIRRQHLNYMRTETIRFLKKEFKNQFIGGLFEDEYSKKVAPDCLLESNKLAKRRYYFPTLKKATIAVTSSGIHSVGWSIGEYISLSKAIVAETLMDIVPGNFAPNNNYLEFSSPDQCAECCQTLIDDPVMRYHIMLNNNIYYHRYLKPESLMFNVISRALGNMWI